MAVLVVGGVAVAAMALVGVVAIRVVTHLVAENRAVHDRYAKMLADLTDKLMARDLNEVASVASVREQPAAEEVRELVGAAVNEKLDKEWSEA